MKAEPKVIETTQQGVHPDLADVVNKYKQTTFSKPIAQHTQTAFDEVLGWLSDWRGEVIIDACCGVGESTSVIAQRYPDCKVIGIDKSAARLAKHQYYDEKQDKNRSQYNHIVIQADLTDFWRLLHSCLDDVSWTIKKQFLLYPNPYPKKSQIQKRWHASPTFPTILACNTDIEVRSNWLVYLQEFQVALKMYQIDSVIKELDSAPITPFERKYVDASQKCWVLSSIKARY